MDFSAMLRGTLPALVSNMSGEYGNSTHPKTADDVVKSLLPLFGAQFNPVLRTLVLFYHMTGSHLGIDPTLILTAIGFFWAGNKLWKQLCISAYGILRDYLMSSVNISSNDEMYLHMMKWLAGQPKMVNSRSLAAETTSKTAWEYEEDTETLTTRISADGSGVYLNFSNQEAKAPPRFIPALGTHGFWFGGRWFRLHRRQESLYDDGGTGAIPQFKDKEIMVLSCFGRSPNPIKELLRHAKEQFYHDHYAKTTVKRPSPQQLRRYGGRHSWMQVANRPVRPMGTVVLDAKQKVQVLRDMNEYLHPATPRWYANRGIPLRRGYLFHGPPGTGKTSLSFALAGVFGLDIYVISLLEPSLTEEDLSALFNSLPRRCIVLLEDIDTAGLARPPDVNDPNAESKNERGEKKGKGKDKNGNSTTVATESSAESSKSSNWKVEDLARELKKANDTDQKKGISLSGLLNAIDGVASHEGRVLIMTTNKPESLDDALIRPGRIDLQVGFTNATREQARELFERMYEGDTQAKKQIVALPGPRSPTADVDAALRPPRHASPAPLPNKAVLHVSKSGEEKYDINGHSRDSSTTSSHDQCEDEEDSVVSEKTTGTASEVTSTSPSSVSPEVEGQKQIPSKDKGAEDVDEPRTLDEAELGIVALEFATKIPDGQFSPAEIQGFLLKRKKMPHRALAEVDVWVDAMVQQKASKTKVLQVQ